MPTRLLHPFRNWQRMTGDEQREIRNLALVLIPCLALAIFVIGMFMVSLTRPLRAEAPFVFSQAVYQPITADVCPGEPLAWPVAFEVRRAPVMVISVRSVWDVERNQTVTLPPTANVGALMFTNYTETTDVSRTVQIVTPDLAPGQYQIRAAVQEFNSQAAAYSVPFSVRGDC
jgi:hypothetical protein